MSNQRSKKPKNQVPLNSKPPNFSVKKFIFGIIIFLFILSFFQTIKNDRKELNENKIAIVKIKSDKGFRDFHWGDEISNMPPDFEIDLNQSFGNAECVTVGRLKNEKLTIGDVKITNIDYYFFNNQLGRVCIHGDWKNYDLIRELLTAKYGNPIKPYHKVDNPLLKSILGADRVQSNDIEWYDEEVTITLLEYFQETFALTYLFVPLKKQFDECEENLKKRSIEEAKQRKMERDQQFKKQYKNAIDEL